MTDEPVPPSSTTTTTPALSRGATIALRVSAVLTLIGLALMVWSILVPTPLPVMLAMSVGQMVGTAAFGLYIFIVVRELRRNWRPR